MTLQTSWFGNLEISCLHLPQRLPVLALAARIKQPATTSEHLFLSCEML